VGRFRFRRSRRARVGGQEQGGHGYDGGGEASDVTLDGAWAFEHGDLATAMC
jgi:hypothetical protein